MKQKKIIPYPFNLVDNPLLPDNKLLDVFIGKPFWIWNKELHDIRYNETGGKCCHVDILGRPQKNGIDFPIFDYQKLVFDAIENNMNIWILKSRGIGLTTFMIYYLSWKILSSTELDHESIFIISGTSEAHANYIKEKMAKLFERNFPSLNIYTKYTELVLKNTWIKVFPTTAVKDLRGYFSAKYIFVDESDYFPESVRDELIHAITPYQTKSNCKIILSSTPYKPNGLMQRIEQDQSSKYFKLKLPYQLGLDKIYNRQQIEQRKQDIEFKREFELQYLGKTGNVFVPQQIDNCIQLADKLKDIPISNYNLHSVGVDFGFGSSKTAIIMTEHLKGEEDKIIVRFAEEYDKSNPQSIVDICHSLYRNHWNTYFFVDGANRGAVNLMKVAFDESLDWDTNDINPESMKICPINFTKNHKQMLSHLHVMVNKNYLAILSKYDKLITSLRTAYATEYSLDKEQTSYNDLIDALRLSLKGYNIT